MSYQLKLDRAKKRIDAFDKAIKLWRECKPFEIIAVDNPNSEKTLIVYKEVLPIPDSWSLDLSDILFGYRSALDNITFELASKYAASPLQEPTVSKIMFPIVIDPSKYTETANRCLAGGIHGAVDALINAVQPFHAADASSHPLFILNELHRIDKHRRIQTVGFMLKNLDLVPIGDVKEIEYKALPSGPIKDGAVVASFIAEGQVGIKHTVTFAILFESGFAQATNPGIMKWLLDIHDTVQAIVTNLESFL